MAAHVTFRATFMERIDAMTIKDPSGCWTWRGHLGRGGYPTGTFTVNGKSGTKSAHRVVYTELVGPIAPGLVIEHECRNTACVRPGPGHCVPLTAKQNCDRSRKRHANASKRACKAGHLFDPTNTRIDEAPGRKRVCRACHARRQAERRARLAA